MSISIKERERWFDIRDKIADFVLEDFILEDIESVEDNCGTLWITLKNKEVYYVQVDKTET